MMKKIIKQIQLLILMLLVSMGLMAQNGTNMFKSAEEAANKGKQDLLEVVKSGRDLNLGVTAAQLENAKPGTLVARKMLDFNKLLNLSDVKSLDDIIAPMGSQASIVPLMVNGKVVTVIEVMQVDGGWKVVGLGGSVLANELSAVMKTADNTDVTIYEVPNLRTLIYAVKQGSSEVYYSNYKGNSLRQPMPKSKLFEVLQADAKAFQAEYGDKVKDQRLVR